MAAHVAALLSLAVAAGCDGLGSLLGTNITTIELVNNGDFSVEVEIVTGEDQNVLGEDLLDASGTNRTFTLQPGESETFSDDCDSIQAVQIVAADLQLLGEIGPGADSEIFRDGSDFGCGDTIRFSFDHPLLPVELTIDVSVN